MAAMESQTCPRRLHSLADSLSALLSTACDAGETEPFTSRSEEHMRTSLYPYVPSWRNNICSFLNNAPRLRQPCLQSFSSASLQMRRTEGVSDLYLDELQG